MVERSQGFLWTWTVNMISHIYDQLLNKFQTSIAKEGTREKARISVHMGSHMTIDQIWENIKTSIMLKKSCSNDTVDKKTQQQSSGQQNNNKHTYHQFCRSLQGSGVE